MEERDQSESCVISWETEKSMVCDSGMMDVEGMRVYTCTPPIGGQA